MLEKPLRFQRAQFSGGFLTSGVLLSLSLSQEIECTQVDTEESNDDVVDETRREGKIRTRCGGNRHFSAKFYPQKLADICLSATTSRLFRENEYEGNARSSERKLRQIWRRKC